MPKKNSPDQYRILVALLLVAAILFLSFLAFRNYKVETYSEGSKSSPSVAVVLIHADWCGHCVKYLNSGVFDNVAEAYDGKVVFDKWEHSKCKDKLGKYGVSGFPTIIAINADTGDKLMDFHGDRSNQEDLKKFAEQALVAGASASKTQH